MKYITSCPQCDTQFLLDDEMIKAYRGKVQCGSCEHVFNAKNRLTEVDEDINSAEEYQASLEADTSEETVDDPITITPEEESDADDDTSFSIEIEDEPAIEAEEVEIYINEETSPETHIIDQASTAVIAAPGNIDDFSKHISPTKQKKVSKPRPVFYSVLCILLITLAGLQSIYHLRVKLAAMYPQYKPYLIQACQKIQCTIELPKELDYLAIENSDMQEDNAYESVINFSTSLKNNALYSMAYPNIELTLTNAEDKIVLRKLLKPETYLTEKSKIKNGLSGRDSDSIKLALQVDQLKVAGYRILLAY